MSQRRLLDQERAASRTFLDQVLRVDKDKAFVIQFDREVTLLQDLTSSRQKLQAAIDQIAAPQFSQGGSSGSSGGSSGGSGGGDAVRTAGRWRHVALRRGFPGVRRIDEKQPGRKAVVILTDGVDHGSKETLEEAIATAQRSDTLVYCILFADKKAMETGRIRRSAMGGGWAGEAEGAAVIRHARKNRIPRKESS